MDKGFFSGVALRILAVFLVTAMSAVIRLVTVAVPDVPVGQIIFWRASVALIPIAGYMMVRGEFPVALTTRHPRLHITRSLLGVVAMFLMFTALRYLPVANAESLGYLGPVLALPLAAVMLGEQIRLVSKIAVGLGFAGVLAMMGAAFDMPGQGAVIGVVAAFLFACTTAFLRVYTKAMTATERPVTIAFYFAFTGAVVGALSAVIGWAVLPGWAMGMLALAGVLGGLGHIAGAEAMARAPVSVLAPLDFTGLIWAVGFDLILFSTLPTVWAWVGMALITGAAVLVMGRSGR